MEANLFGSSYIYCHVFNFLEYAYTVIYLMLQCDKMYYSCFDIGNWIFFWGGVWVLILFVIEVWRLIFDNLIFKGGGMQNILDSMTPPTLPLDWSALVCKPSVWILSSVILDHVGLNRFWCHWGHLHCNRPLTQWMVIQFQNPINLLFQFINAFIG